jgi:hypothetical protein
MQDDEFNPFDIENLSRIRSVRIDNQVTSNDIKNWFDLTFASRGWIVYRIQGVENVGSLAVPLEFLQGIVGYINRNSDQVWVAPMGQVAAYIEMRSVAVPYVRNVERFRIEVAITDTSNLPDNVTSYPVSAMTKIPELWDNAKATQNNRELNGNFARINNDPWYIYECYLDQGPILLERAELSIASSIKPTVRGPYPNPCTDHILLSVENLPTGTVYWDIFDTRGRLVQHIEHSNPERLDNINVKFDMSRLPPGIYLHRWYIDSASESSINTDIKGEGKIIHLR